jgi:hypothetical protein
MIPQPTHELIRDLIAANFPIQIIGDAKHTSQFGVPYIAFVQGVAVPQGKGIGEFTTPISRADVNMATVEWISQQPKDHDVVVWRVMPEEIMPEYGNAIVRWRMHTMSSAQLVAHLTRKRISPDPRPNWDNDRNLILKTQKQSDEIEHLALLPDTERERREDELGIPSLRQYEPRT